MANTKSAIKAARKAVPFPRCATRRSRPRPEEPAQEVRRRRSRRDGAAAKAAGMAYVSAMDRAVKSGVVHRNAASHAKAKAAKHIFAK